MALEHGFSRHFEEQLRAVAVKHATWGIEIGMRAPNRIQDGVSAVKAILIGTRLKC